MADALIPSTANRKGIGGRPRGELTTVLRLPLPLANLARRLREELAEAVATFTARAAEKTRRQALAAARLLVFVHTDRFGPAAPQYDGVQPVALPVATADTGRLIGAALRALAVSYRPGFRDKKAGVIFLDLIPAESVMGCAFNQ